MSTKIKTKYGNANLNWRGHYKITSSKEGNFGKTLHRLIYEDYHKVTVLDYAVVHHIDENKTNNNISNLKLMTKKEHMIFHKKNKPQSKSQIERRKLAFNKSGIKNVYTQKGRNDNIVFAYRYKVENKYKSLTSIDLLKLYNKVIENNLCWDIINKEVAYNFCLKYGYLLKNKKIIKI